jgi:glycosyltransferase involved in cell wall biosynthesis
MPTPAVSVVIPTFRRPKRLERAIESVLHQTFGDFECIVIDGGSKDETASVVSRIAEKDPRVRYVEIEDLGISASRNAGVRESRAEFVAFLDDDDEFFPRYLERVIETFRKLPEDVGAVGTGMIIEDPWGLTSYAAPAARPFWKCIVGSGWTFRRNIFVQSGIWFDEEMRGQEDWEFSMRFGRKYRAEVIPEQLRLYHMTFPNFRPKKVSLSSNRLTEYENVQGLLRRHKAAFKAAGPEAIAAVAYISGIACGRAGKMDEARALLWESLSAQFTFNVFFYYLASHLGKYPLYAFDYFKTRGMRLLRVLVSNRPANTSFAK